MAILFSCVFNWEIPENFLLKCFVFSKYFHVIPVAECHKLFKKLVTDFNG